MANSLDDMIICRSFPHDSIASNSIEIDLHRKKLWESYQKVEQPVEMNIKLFNHQLVTVYNMEKLEKDRKRIINPEKTFITDFGILGDSPGYGKCEKKDTPIIMFNGDIKMNQDIVVGDLVMGDDSKPRKVLSIHKGHGEMFKIKQTNGGEDYVVNKDHILSLKLSVTKKIKKNIVSWFVPEKCSFETKTFSVEEKAQDFFNNINVDRYIDIPLSKYMELSKATKRNLKGYRVGVDFPEKHLDFNPYFVGRLLNEGLSFIPKDFKINSRENRLKLLAGFIDSSRKSVCKEGYYEFFPGNTLLEDLLFLIRSLGFKATTDKERSKISFSVLGGCDCFIKVEPVGLDDYYGFALDGNHRYLHKDFTVTHNSYSIVALLVRNKMPWDVSCEHMLTTIDSFGYCLKLITKQKFKTRVNANLLLASSNLIEQWKEYFSHVIPGKLAVKEISLKSHMENFDPDEWDVVLVSSCRYNEFMNFIGNQIVWKRFIFDDAASTPIPNMCEITAGFIWFVSATFNGLLHIRNLGYMKKFFRDFNHQTLSHLTIKNDDGFLKESFKMPEVIYKKHKCINPRILGVLNNHIDNEIKIMISAGDIKGAILKLGGGIYNDGNLIDIVVKRHKEKLLMAIASLEMWTSRGHAKEIENWTKRIKEIEGNIKDLDEKYKNILNEDCPICYDIMNAPTMSQCCNTVFCCKCILKCIQQDNKNCPMCRTPLTPKELIFIDKNDQNKDPVEYKKAPEKQMEKPDKILEIVSNCLAANGKILIFSGYDVSFDIIKRLFKINNIKYVEISGSKATRDLKIKKFQDGEINIICLNSLYNGAGLNLTSTTDIIFYHEMDSMTREQNIGRALRIGRQVPLTVHDLVY
jgi:hypothetical protein